jgi:prolipoprotein diacylglyceryltransferase
MLLLILIMMSKYQIKLWKGLPVTVLLTITGTIGTYIWYFIESARFGAQSYYGAVFLVPLAFIYIAKLMKIPYGDIMDFCAPAECVMLAIMKYRCLIDGCCAGKVLLSIAMDGSVIFPSQIVELVNAFVLMAVLLGMAFCKKTRGKIYAWYLVLYGATRFVLNLFRADTTPFLLGLPVGNIWSLLAIFLGILWLTDRKLIITKKTPGEDVSL